MNAAYFAIGCILIILAIYWGSAPKEPTRLATLFGPSPEKKPHTVAPKKKKVRW